MLDAHQIFGDHGHEGEVTAGEADKCTDDSQASIGVHEWQHEDAEDQSEIGQQENIPGADVGQVSHEAQDDLPENVDDGYDGRQWKRIVLL